MYYRTNINNKHKYYINDKITNLLILINHDQQIIKLMKSEIYFFKN